jgi:hypothetical protein
MKKQAFIVFVFLMVTSSLSQRHMLLFQHQNQAGPATRVTSENVCIILAPAGFPFQSGRTGGAYTCRVWYSRDCGRGGGSSLEVTSAGRNWWAGGAWSMMC